MEIWARLRSKSAKTRMSVLSGAILGFSLFIGCTIRSTNFFPSEDLAYLTPIPEETIQAFRENQHPVRNRLEAVISASSHLNTTRLSFNSPPGVIFAEKMSFADAIEEMEKLGHTNITDQLPNSQMVWLVIFKGDYFIQPPDPGQIFTPPPRTTGCAYVLFPIEDIRFRSAGTIACPP